MVLHFKNIRILDWCNAQLWISIGEEEDRQSVLPRPNKKIQLETTEKKEVEEEEEEEEEGGEIKPT